LGTPTDSTRPETALARAHRLQLWDCVVCAASHEARAQVLLTEDMQDGRILDGLRLMNPFAPANAKSIDELLAE
jgi:predicted nucleic acid-binding protein